MDRATRSVRYQMHVAILMVIKAVSDHIEAFHPVATLLKG